ncbi:MAG: Calx-beta domain-containing protein [Gammaproteobacteria bacterium]
MRPLVRCRCLPAVLALFAGPAFAPAAAFAAGVLQFADPYLEVREGEDDWITVVRTGSAEGSATVVLNVSLGGTATTGDDFRVDLPLGVVQLADGELFARVALELPQDSETEGTEYASLSLGNPSGATLARSTTLLLQIEDDETPAALFRLPGDSVRRVDEGASLSVTVERSGLPNENVAITLVGPPGTAAPGIDFTDVTTVLDFAAGDTSTSVDLLTLEDDEVEGPETLALLLASPEPEGRAGFAGTGPLVVITDGDGDPAGEFSIFANSAEVDESGAVARFTVDRNRGSSGTATVSWSTVDGAGDNDANAGTDYEAATGELVFAPGETRKTLAVVLVNDESARPDRRQFQVVLGNPSLPAGIDPEGRSATVSIREDDRGGDSDDDCSGTCDCFVATAAWGSWMHPHVVSLRDFRDAVLMRSPQGRAFVAFYYRHSPPLAAFIGRHEILRATARTLLAPVVLALERPAAAAGLLLLAIAGLNLRYRATRKP